MAISEAAEEREVMTPFPNKRYSIIYADPPWSYRDKQKAGKRGAGFKYEIPKRAWLNHLPVWQLAKDDCLLFLWVPIPQLRDCWSLIEGWGFTYKTAAFVWVKRNKKAWTWFWGMGSWTRANTELCLLATRGRPKRVSAAVHSVIDTSIRAHSQKPDEVRDRIVELCGDVPRIELFARQRVPGWDAWGNGLEGV